MAGGMKVKKVTLTISFENGGNLKDVVTDKQVDFKQGDTEVLLKGGLNVIGDLRGSVKTHLGNIQDGLFPYASSKESTEIENKESTENAGSEVNAEQPAA